MNGLKIFRHFFQLLSFLNAAEHMIAEPSPMRRPNAASAIPSKTLNLYIINSVSLIFFSRIVHLHNIREQEN